MSSFALPEHPSLEYLKKLAKERLRTLRETAPSAQLAAAQLAVARDHGFASWRELKAEVDRRRAPTIERFLAACRNGDLDQLKLLLAKEPALVRERDDDGGAGLHAAVAHPKCVRLLLEQGADPNARDRGDNASPLHFAAGGGFLESLRLLLDAGGDVHGFGDLHKADVIGWAVGNGRRVNREVVKLLIERGARHHIFSAIALDDRDLVQAIVERDPDALSRRRSRFEQGQTPLHFALAAPDGLEAKTPQYAMAELLIELGADLEAEDDKGRTPLAFAMLRGDRQAMSLLKAAGATVPQAVDPASDGCHLESLRDSVRQQVTPMLSVDDVDAAVDWYQSLGFSLRARYPDSGAMTWAALAFGKVDLMLQPCGVRSRGQVALWFTTSRIDEIYDLFKSRQLKAGHAALTGQGDGLSEIQFLEDLYEPFYGGRQFSVRDVNGIELVFQSA